MDWIPLLRHLQSDFISRLKSGCLLHCEAEGQHSELTIISGERLRQLRGFCWKMAEKYKRVSPVRDVFISFLKGKLGEEVVKERLADFITEVDYEKRLGGDGNIDFTLTENSVIGIEVKSRYGSIDKVKWSVSSDEVQKNSVIVCILIKEEVNEAQSEYHLFLAGFLPTQMIKLKTGRIAFGIEQLLYGGGLRFYLEEKLKSSKHNFQKQIKHKHHQNKMKDDTLICDDEDLNFILVKLGDENLAKGEYDAAISAYSQALQVQPYDAEVYYKRGNAYYNKEDYPAAITDYIQVININPNYIQAYNKSGNARYYMGDYEGAIAEYTHVITIHPDDAFAYRNRAYVRSCIGDNQGAIEDYTEAIRINPQFDNIEKQVGNSGYLLLGNQPQLNGNRDSENQYIPSNIHVLPQENEVNLNEVNLNDSVDFKQRGNFHYEFGDYQRAIVDYTQAIVLNIHDIDAYYHRGNCYSQLGNKQAAIDDYTQVISINYSHGDAYYHRGNCRYELGDKQGTIEDFQKASDIYRKTGRLAEHKNVCERILDLQIEDSLDILQF
jgi:tetratricopeptide (TPR) repeat protein